MTERPDDTPDFLAKPVSPSGEQPTEPPPTQPLAAEPTSPYVTPPQPGQPDYGGYQGPGYGASPPPQQGGYAPYAPMPGMPGYPFAQAHGGANVAMGLGITSVVCALAAFVCCVTIPGVLTGPFAIALAIRARKEIAQNPGMYNNDGAATTGLITGIIGTVVGLVVVGVVVFFLGAIYSFDDF